MSTKVHKGDLTAKPGVVYDYTEITGGLYARGADTKTAFPKLTTVGGGLDARGADTKTAFPKLTTVGGGLDARGADTKTAFPKLTTVGGGLDASGADTKTAFPKLTTVGGWLYARGADTKTAFPKLTTVGGGLDASGADTKTAFPKLTTVGGWLYASGADTKTAFPKLTTVGGWLDASGADTKTAFPKLTTVGGWLYARGADTKTAFPKLRHQNDPAALTEALAAQGLVRHDGVLSRVVRSRGPVTVVQVVGQASRSYVVTDGTHTAHGKTLAEARADLRVKQGPRDTKRYRTWTSKTVVAQEDAIAAYRAITGACGAGVSHFLAGRRLPARLSVARILAETQGQYGHDVFAAFIAKRKEAA